MATRTGAQSRGTLAPRSCGSKLAAPGPGLQALSVLKRRARAHLSREPAASGVLAQSRSDYFSRIATVLLQRGGSGIVKVGARTSELRLGRTPRPSSLRLASLGGKKKRIKQVTYLCLLGVRLETWGGLGLQSRVPDTRLASSGCLQPGARSALPSNKTLATQAPPAPRGDLGTPFQPALAPRFPGWPAEPTQTTCFLTYSSVSYPSSCRSHTDPGPPPV